MRKTRISLADKIDLLSDPRTYGVDEVETIETHMSWVFLTNGDVYKMKKPVQLPFLDFTSPAARHHNCLMEVELNRRLAPDVYLGIEGLVRTPTGELQMGGEGETVEWLVHMRRLPSDRMLDRLIRERRVEEAAVRAAATLLARFYREAPRVHYPAANYEQRLRDETDEAAAALRDYGLSAELVDYTARAQQQFLMREAALIARRAGRVIEAHGDLRPEHVCLADPPVILDCLEFNRDFRLLDPVDELAFLGMECELLGAAFVGAIFLDIYSGICGDDPPARLLAFHKCHRACLRAKLAVWHLGDDPRQLRRNWMRLAMMYLDRAGEYARLLGAP